MLLPAKCFVCAGANPACPRCGGTGTLALAVDLAEGVSCWTRKCPDCGWTNGLYWPRDGMPVPTEGAIVNEQPEKNFCMRCPRGPDGRYRTGHMIWTKLS